MTSSSNARSGETRFSDPEDRWTFLTDGEEDLEEIHSPHSATKPTGRVGCLKGSPVMRILPLDIVYELLPFLETRDLLMFMRTCKALRERGARHILSRRIPIRRVEPFASFMEASPHRYQYLLHVIYLPHRAEPASIKRLVSVLSQASALVLLELLCRLDKLEDVLKKKLFDAVSRISSLRCLRISTHGAGHLTDHALLLRLSPRLTSLRLSFDAPTDPFSALPSALLDNLETLHLEQASFMPLETPLLRLKSLTAQDSFLRTRTLVTSFPNLRNLRLLRTGRGAHLPLKQTETAAIRSINVNEQMEQSWSSLDTLSGNLISLHNLALAAPVHTLHIETEIVVGVHDQLLCTVLQDTRPSRLSVTLDHRSAESTSPSLDGVRALLQTGTNLNHLSLSVVWRSCELGEGDIQAAKDFIDALFDTIARLPLETVRLNITKTILFRPQNPENSVGLNAYEIALRLVRQMPTLRHVMVHYQVLNLERTRMRYWAVSRTDEDCMMRELEPSIGEEVVGGDLSCDDREEWW